MQLIENDALSRSKQYTWAFAK